jgi:hypothetical protein
MSCGGGVRTGFVLTCFATIALANLHGQSFRTVTASRLVSEETALNVRVEFAAGTLNIEPGDRRMLYQGEIYYDEDKFDANTDFDPDRQTLSFGIDTRNGGMHLGRLETPQRLDLALSPDVPTRLKLELGAVEARIELGGMTISSVDLQTGAAKTHLSFSEPNRGHCRSIELVVAAAEFHAYGLANSRCETIRFEGGVGDITLDFTGDWVNGETTEAEIELGIGQLTLRLPKSLGVAIEVDRFLASFDRAGFTKRGSRYVSQGYETASQRLTISVKAVLGNIEIDWVER